MTLPTKLSPRHLAYIFLLTNTAIWGSALPIVKPALEHVSSFHYLFFRYLIAAPLSLPILIYLLHKYRPHLPTISKIIAIETVQALGLLFLFSGLRLTTSIEASFITNSSPIFTTLGGVILLKEKEERHELIGMLIAVLGISLVTLEPLITGSNHNLNSISLWGNLLVLGFALNFSTYSLLTKKYYRQVPKLLAACINFWISLLLFFTITYISFGAPADLINTILSPLSIPSVTIAALYMGILGSIVALPVLIIGYQLIEVSEASLFTYLQPLFYLPLAILWLKEPFTIVMFIALILIATGVYTAEKRTSKPKPPHKPR